MAESQVTSPSDAHLDFDDDTVKAIARVYSNRATAHFYLENYQEALNDATAAVTLEPTFIKAIERGASACVKLKRYAEARTWCDKGLAKIDKNNKTLVDLRTKCLSEPNTSQETKRENMKSIPVTHTAIGQQSADSLPKTAKDVGNNVEEETSNVMTESQVTSPSDAHLDFDDDTVKAIAKVYGNRATAHFYLGNYQEALNDATAAVTLEPTFIKAVERGASACVKLKRYEEATTWCDKGLAIDNNNKTLVDLRTRCLNEPNTSQETKQQDMKSVAVTHTAIGQQREDSLPKTAKDVGNNAEEETSYDNTTNARDVLGNLNNAITYQSLGDLTTLMVICGNLGNAYESMGDFKTAIDYHERHLEIAKEVGDKAGEGGSYGNLGNAYLGLGDFKTAIDYHERHLEIAKEVGDKAGAAKSLHNLGMSFELQGSLPKALDCFYSSVRMFNIIRHDLKGKDEWKISYRNEYEITYTSLWRLLLKQGKVDEALFAAEQGRAQALNDLMEFKYGFETTYCQLLNREESTYNSFSFPPSIAVFIAIDERDIVFWVIEDGKEVQLRKKKLSDNNSIKMKDFLKSLIVTTSREIDVTANVECEDRSLDKLGDEQVTNGRFPQTPIKPVPLQMNALRTFYDVIIEPIADLVHGDELILVPEGPLCLAPYAAFVDSNATYLCDVCRIRVIPSLTSLKMITDSPDGYHSKTGVLLVGDPWVQEVVCQGKILMEQLPCARKEVQMIGSLLNAKPLTGKEATKDEVLKRLPSVALIHIAAHGRMETGEIALAPNITRASEIPAREDFLLTMKDVTSAQIRARLVVLSCCHSGRGEIKAEGVVGIARAFLGAGARTVLVSLWAIDDEATLEFMKLFYSYLVKGISASKSLNKVMKSMRESDEFNEVKHWAPFVLIGDDVTLEFGGRE